ncbi:hypothetical protein PSQ19_05185 [Devosia algicola]|uniref:Alcohol dehydrogenase n=1 Tax=Devosia algicola TaxID=3026418 RepID=A0ABY7YQ90_9HYPH|nr:hypothetical protein [Devosia algicola]WDR03494.1 hypothetical protein PSQ19_05185 [Devosia algicola]
MRFVERWQDRVPFEKMISNSYSLDQVNEALGGMKALTEIKPVIEFA